jgi:hypothetical protein
MYGQEGKHFHSKHLTIFTKHLKKKIKFGKEVNIFKKSAVKAANVSSNPD